MQLQCGSKKLDLSTPVVMGVLNITPDSFSDGGLFLNLDSAVAHGQRLVEEGAGILDVGGESTRPGALDVTEEEELRRVLPVVERLAARVAVPISIDTSKPAVMRAAVAAGASMINDVRALRARGALEAAATGSAAICLMHMQGEPRTMQHEPRYDDVVKDVGDFLRQRVDDCVAAGIVRQRLAIDPGFGFGKRLEHDLALLGRLDEFTRSGLPLLVGLSRKSMIGTITGRPGGERLPGSVAAAVIAVLKGASIVRAHDVAATVDAVRLAAAVVRAGGSA